MWRTGTFMDMCPVLLGHIGEAIETLCKLAQQQHHAMDHASSTVTKSPAAALIVRVLHMYTN